MENTKLVPWWLVLMQGIAAVILGFFLVSSPTATTFVLVQVLGIYWLVGGIFQIIGMFIDSSAWGWKLFAGIIGILAGISILNHPLWSTFLIPSVLVIVLGVQGIITGILSVVMAFKGSGWGTGIMGALSILFGILLIGSPLVAALALPWVVGIFAIAGGIAGIVAAFRLK